MDPLDQFLPAQPATDPLDALLEAPAAPREATGAQAKPTAQNFSGEQVPVDELGWAATAGHGLANTLERWGLGATQIANKVGMLAGLPGSEDRDASLKQEAVEMKSRQAPIEETTSGMLGGLVPSLLVPGSTIPRAIAGGLALGAMEPETGATADPGSVQDVIGERATNALQTGGIFGAGSAVGRGIGKVVNRVRAPARGGRPATALEASRAKEVVEAEELGLKVDVSGRTGGRFAKGLRSVFRDLPVTGGRQKAFDEANTARANQVLAQQFGSDAKVLTPDVIKEAKGVVGAEFEKYVHANAPILVDKPFMISMKSLKRQVELLPQGQRDPQLVGIVKDLYDDIAPNWKPGGISIDGERYKVLRTRLTNKARTASRDVGRDSARQINSVVEALDDMAGRSVPEDLQAGYKAARKQWQGIKIAEDAVDESGNVVRSKLKNSIRRHMPNEGKDIFRKLNRAMKVSGEDVANSGTPLRSAAMIALAAPTVALTGIPGVGAESGPLDYAQGIALPLAVQAAMLNPYTARYITRQLATPGPGQQALIEALQRGASVGAFGAMQESQQ